ncbi:MAG TPA: hypothetical protein ENN80_08920, partial [Candidatus Hydrogenedentes bacterium]|nr:hypothetical protein [Candidatus Hydrogenedentota bacterium]
MKARTSRSVRGSLLQRHLSRAGVALVFAVLAGVAADAAIDTAEISFSPGQTTFPYGGGVDWYNTTTPLVDLTATSSGTCIWGADSLISVYAWRNETDTLWLPLLVGVDVVPDTANYAENNVVPLHTILVDGNHRQVRVRFGTNCLEYTETNTLEFWADLDPPTAPGTPVDEGDYSNSANLTWTWTAATDDGSGLQHYHVLIGTTPGGSDKNDTYTASEFWEEPNCTHGETYYCTVIAVDNVENEQAAAESSDGITVDLVAPAPAISGDTGLTNATRQLQIDFGEAVSGFVVGDISVSNGTASNLGGGTNGLYTVDITGDDAVQGPIEVRVSIPAGVALDIANNPNSASTPAPYFSFLFDGFEPEPVISGDTDLTN